MTKRHTAATAKSVDERSAESERLIESVGALKDELAKTVAKLRDTIRWTESLLAKKSDRLPAVGLRR